MHLGFVAASGRLESIKCGAVTPGGMDVSLTAKIYPRALLLTPGVVQGTAQRQSSLVNNLNLCMGMIVTSESPDSPLCCRGTLPSIIPWAFSAVQT